MMELILPRSWKDEFAQAAAMKREEILYKEKTARFDERQREEREEVEDKQEADDLAYFEQVLASTEQVEAFRAQLDDYDAKTVEALMDNREALEAVRQQIDDMLDKAEVLPDGRRVFKTKDGQRVFDEHGQQLSSEVIDPNSIDDKKPKWEAFKAEVDAEKLLIEKQQELLAYQAKLDEARDRLDKGDITKGELDKIKADLSADMPNAVRKKLDIEEPKADANVKPQADASALPDDMDNLMRQTGLVLAPSML